ncbi:phage tail assembly protein [Paenibacillus anseongense]|uniref:phage tail assembly protein n=1 Tax=Paenibacillus anseongense TaxID=2682845 RepID=UPI00119B93A6|nr:phage tail assembly protein [Paenibacillus anseongense]MEC0269057.1 phage tail assembly protein [Paenibacillus anseongense]
MKENETVNEDIVFTLSKPVVSGDQTITSVVLDFESLTGDDLLAIERQYNAISARTRDVAPVKETSKQFLSFVVAKAAGLQVEDLQRFSAKDFAKLTLRAQNFLLG